MRNRKKAGDALASLRAARIRADLSQEQVATACNVSQSGYSKIERGERPPGKDLAERIGDCVGVSWREIWPDLEDCTKRQRVYRRRRADNAEARQ